MSSIYIEGKRGGEDFRESGWNWVWVRVMVRKEKKQKEEGMNERRKDGEIGKEGDRESEREREK